MSLHSPLLLLLLLLLQQQVVESWVFGTPTPDIPKFMQRASTSAAKERDVEGRIRAGMDLWRPFVSLSVSDLWLLPMPLVAPLTPLSLPLSLPLCIHPALGFSLMDPSVHEGSLFHDAPDSDTDERSECSEPYDTQRFSSSSLNGIQVLCL